jgi:pimeloyl-ACP methyl ester carboxylesterase
MRPALEALSKKCRAISYTLDEASSLDGLVEQLDRVLDDRGIETAAICGVSFGGVVAVRYAAARPGRTSALVVASAPSPSWRPSGQQAKYLARPWLSTPAFLATSPLRMWPEIAAAIPSPLERMRFAVTHGWRILTHPIVPAAMAARIGLMQGVELCEDCTKVRARTLVITGDETLDRVVPAAATREYARLIRGARCAMMNGTGHIGPVTQPDRFAAVVTDFVNANHS